MITDTKYPSDHTPFGLEKKVNDLVAQGYAPHGRSFMADGLLVQTMVKDDAVAPFMEQTVYTEDGAISFDARINTAILQGTANAMTLAAPTLADNGKRLRIVNEVAATDAVITSPANKLQTGDGVGLAIQGNTLTIKDDTVRAFIELEANNERWLLDGFYQFYGYTAVTTVP